jgi:hypothetical protein
MIRRAKLQDMPEVIDGFRMRGTEVSRMEAFADCGFGFGLTLIVVQLDVPKRFDELWMTMRGFLGFAFCFAVFFGVWSRHYTFCRRFGLQDAKVRVLTAALLFVILAYLYPLKFLTVVFVTWVLNFDIGWKPVPGDQIDIGQLFIVYGVGFAAIQLVFTLLYLHAYRMRDRLQLDELEGLDARSWVWEQGLYLIIPAISILTAILVRKELIGLAGYAYVGMGFVGWFHGSRHRKRHRELAERLEAEGRLSEETLSTENEMIETPG